MTSPAIRWRRSSGFATRNLTPRWPTIKKVPSSGVTRRRGRPPSAASHSQTATRWSLSTQSLKPSLSQRLNIDTVPAIDPESEGRKPDPKLSPEDREVVTLWMLSPTRVGPKDNTPAIAAKRYVAPLNTQDTPEATAPVQVASAAPAPVVQPRRVRSAPVQIAKAEPAEAPRVHTPVRKLPQTASNLPLLLLLCVLSLFTAAALRFSRTRA